MLHARHSEALAQLVDARVAHLQVALKQQRPTLGLKLPLDLGGAVHLVDAPAPEARARTVVLGANS